MTLVTGGVFSVVSSACCSGTLMSSSVVVATAPILTEVGCGWDSAIVRIGVMDRNSEDLSGISPTLDSSPMAAESIGDPISGKEQYEQEINSLVSFFNEEEGLQVGVRYRKDPGTPGINIQRKKIAAFLEGSPLPFSALVKDVFEKLSCENDQDQSKNGVVTMALVRSNVLSIGERISFGITNADTDVLEDDTAESLWRWEVRDVKLLSRGSRDEILDRRHWRKKIAERIASLSAIVEALRSAEDGGETEQVELRKAREALAKTDDELSIRAARSMSQQKKSTTASQSDPNGVLKNSLGEQPSNLTQEVGNKRRRVDPEEKERLRQEKLLKRQLVENEKEQKRKDREEVDRKKQQQKQQDEAEKEQRRKEKEEAERRKQEKKQQEEAERELKREAERKKQLALKKQASFMDRFLVKKDQANCGQSQQAESQATSPAVEPERRESAAPIVQAVESAAVVARMDIQLKGIDSPNFEELWQSHLSNWLNIRNQSANQSIRKTRRWGVRRKPKVSVYRELRLNGTVGDSRGSSPDDGHVKKSAENSSPASHLQRGREEYDCSEDVDWKVNGVEFYPNSPAEDGKKCNSGRYQLLRNKRRKLLQFDKSHRPPYYGTFSKRSKCINSRRPLQKDPSLDYDVDSDEEWEEEDPGESLSDAEKDEEDEKVEVEDIEDDEDGPDEFVVPDGYLSENEGVAMEDSERSAVTAALGPPNQQSPVTPVHQTMMSLERLRKVLDNATEHAIRSNHPLVISNLGQLPGSEEDVQSSQFPSNRTETLCLEALRIRVLVPNLLIGAC